MLQTARRISLVSRPPGPVPAPLQPTLTSSVHCAASAPADLRDLRRPAYPAYPADQPTTDGTFALSPAQTSLDPIPSYMVTAGHSQRAVACLAAAADIGLPAPPDHLPSVCALLLFVNG
jgi:hypothetical protein